MAVFKSTDDWINARLTVPLNKLESNNLPLVIASQSTHAKMIDRIFIQGKNSTGETFDYSVSYRKTKREFGRASGKETSFVNYTFTANLRSDFANGLIRKNKEIYQTEVKRSDSVDKIGWLEDKYGKTGGLFSLNKDEISNYTKIVELEFKRIMGV